MIKKILYGIGVVALGLTLTYGKANTEHIRAPEFSKEIYGLKRGYCSPHDRMPDIEITNRKIVENGMEINAVVGKIIITTPQGIHTEKYPFAMIRLDDYRIWLDFERDGHWDIEKELDTNNSCETLEDVLGRRKI